MDYRLGQFNDSKVKLLKPTDTSKFPNSYEKLGAGGGGSDPQQFMRINGSYENAP